LFSIHDREDPPCTMSVEWLSLWRSW